MKSKFKWSWVLTKRLLKFDDPLFEDGNIICCLSMKQFTLNKDHEDIADLFEREADIQCGIGTCNKVFKTIVEYESHYNSVHKNVCSICKRFYPSNHLLDIHLLEWHDSMFELLAEKQPMFQCLIPACNTKLSSRKQRKDHMIKIHKYPSNFRFDKEKKPVNKSKVNSQTEANDQNTSESTDMEIVEDKENFPVDKPKIQYSYRVPQNFSFGHGVSRGFQPRKRGRGRGGKSRHWHNQSKESMQVDIEKVDMNDLAEALDIT